MTLRSFVSHLKRVSGVDLLPLAYPLGTAGELVCWNS